MRAILALVAFFVFAAPVLCAAQDDGDGVLALLTRLEQALTRGATAELSTIAAADVPAERVAAFSNQWITPSTTRATIRERDRVPLKPGPGHRLTIDVLLEAGDEGTLATWRLDVVPTDAGWRIAEFSSASRVEGLFRLTLDATRQYRARDLVVTSEDLELRLHEGDVFFVQVQTGSTAAVLLGRGEMVFTPSPDAEKRQIALLTGKPELRQTFDAAFVRFNPADAAQRLPAGQLKEVPVDARALERAQKVFAE